LIADWTDLATPLGGGRQSGSGRGGGSPERGSDGATGRGQARQGHRQIELGPMDAMRGFAAAVVRRSR